MTFPLTMVVLPWYVSPLSPRNLIEAALPQRNNLTLCGLRELLELDPITFLECRGRHRVSLRFLASHPTLSTVSIPANFRTRRRPLSPRDISVH
jgi:hypothetical protein